MIENYIQHLLRLQNSSRYRSLPQHLGRDRTLDFSSNDYLNLSHSSELLKAAAEAGKIYGCGATGSRLLSGNSKLFEGFEAQIAADKNTESSLIFSSGYQANISTLASLLDEKVHNQPALVFFDKLNHASLYQAVQLANAELVRYRHNDITHLADLLIEHKQSSRPKFVVTETLFGMDGDFAPLPQIIELCKQHNALLYLDEAHATGLYGSGGYGISTNYDLSDIPHVIMGTFSKALGASGAYVASSKVICDYLQNSAKGFIYSTAPSPIVVAAAERAWHLVKSMLTERAHISRLADYLRTTLNGLGFDTGNSESHIIPIIFEHLQHAENCLDKLHGANIYASLIRPPTVPANAVRIRLAIRSSHTLSDIDQLINSIAR